MIQPMLKLSTVKQLRLAVYDMAHNRHNNVVAECELDAQGLTHAQRAFDRLP